MADAILGTVAVLDPQNHRAYPAASRDLQLKIEQTKLHLLAYAPWNIWATLDVGPLDGTIVKFAAGQVWIDEARIACALERYRLVHGVYPDSLDLLAPACIDSVPHDIMNGQSYHYQLRADGTFLLYSVGWNQTDEGGKIVFRKDSSTALDFEKGDWVWPTPQFAPNK
jgi:hypothetical protein